MRRVIILCVLLSTLLLLYSCSNRSLSKNKTNKLYEKIQEILEDNNISPIYTFEFNASFEKHIISGNECQMFIKNGDNLNFYHNGFHYTLNEGSNQFTKEQYDYTNLINEEQNQYLALINSLLETVESIEGYKAIGRDIPFLASPDDYWIEMKLDDTKVKDIFNVEEITTKHALIVLSNESTLKGFQFNFEGDKVIDLYIYFIYPDDRMNDFIEQWKNYFDIT